MYNSNNQRKGFPYQSVFPSILVTLIDELYEKYGYPIDFISTAIFTAFAASIGNSTQIKYNEAFIETASIFCVLIGKVNSGKSHPLSWAFKPFFKKNREESVKYQIAKQQYLANEDKKKNKDESYQALPKPISQVFVMNDYTLESLKQTLSENPRGVLIYVDEIMGLMKNLNRYNSGSDIEDYLSLWSHKQIDVKRKLSDPIHIENPFCCIAGTIQTGIVGELFGANCKENGFGDRWLKVFPENLTVPEWNDAEIDPTLTQQYTEAIERIFNIPVIVQDMMVVANILEFSSEARKRIREWRNKEHRLQLIEDENETFAGTHGKMDIYSLRFSLILQMMYWATGEASNEAVELRAVNGAIELVNFFKAETEKVHRLVFDEDITMLMNDKQKSVYDALPEEFKTGEGSMIANLLEMPERTFKRFLANKKFFSNPKYGYYAKISKN